MCGIFGYVGHENCVPAILSGLKTLEYRGYDSAGIAVHTPSGVELQKAQGRLTALESAVDLPYSTVGIGHTRWATHGQPSDQNSHPHRQGSVTLVHNGIIENYADLKQMLLSHGYTFSSETDTEVAAALLDHAYQKTADKASAVFLATSQMEGSFAFAILFDDDPDTVYAIRKASPLIVAKADTACVIASDIPAILPYTNRYVRADENVLCVVKRDSVTFLDAVHGQVRQKEQTVSWNVEQAEKNGYKHFMLKEIHEEPDVFSKTVAAGAKLDLTGVGHIYLVGCGTAMHAGLFGKYYFETVLRKKVSVEIASEFRYSRPILHSDDLAIFISQSGETADTIAALAYVKEQGIKTVAIVNVLGSTLAQMADAVYYTSAGPEISVASTKAYISQCALLYQMTVGAVDATIPQQIEKATKLSADIRKMATTLLSTHDIFFIGRGLDYYLCVEGSLKLKEITYLHSEACAAGELKHGTISLITENTSAVALLTDKRLAPKTVSAIREIKSRLGKVIAIVSRDIAESVEIPADTAIIVDGDSPFAAMTALQLLAYHTADLMGLDVDKPRNLAKSVTVE